MKTYRIMDGVHLREKPRWSLCLDERSSGGGLTKLSGYTTRQEAERAKAELERLDAERDGVASSPVDHRDGANDAITGDQQHSYTLPALRRMGAVLAVKRYLVRVVQKWIAQRETSPGSAMPSSRNGTRADSGLHATQATDPAAGGQLDEPDRRSGMKDLSCGIGSGWPDPTEPGVPAAALDDGYHWLGCPDNSIMTVAQWSPDSWSWIVSRTSDRLRPEEMEYMNYIGPCVLPEVRQR
jgi:hypothetical protein